jgi:hypothetical protein
MRPGTVDDDGDVVVELIEFGALVELLRVLDHQRVQPENVLQPVRLLVTDARQVQPERLLAGCRRGLVRGAGVVHDAAVCVHETRVARVPR